jgi:hypothetical protein
MRHRGHALATQEAGSEGCLVRAVALALPLWLAATAAASQTLQLVTVVSVPADRRGAVRFEAPIEPGDATLSGVARNLRGGAVQVDLAFRYRVPRDTIALDEVIERIEIATETTEGDVFLASAIDTQLIPLNPNRVPLLYRVTLYHPEEVEEYVLRVRVIGNYE